MNPEQGDGRQSLLVRLLAIPLVPFVAGWEAARAIVRWLGIGGRWLLTGLRWLIGLPFSGSSVAAWPGSSRGSRRPCCRF
jgi:hypothetical protein